mmetsp:Transcript_24610/g.30267  ORF Transcript_24610/g.30267 Transcript_24610/m.30267 type:complete len:411 (-) Transcript_24610:20-1252(-)
MYLDRRKIIYFALIVTTTFKYGFLAFGFSSSRFHYVAPYHHQLHHHQLSTSACIRTCRYKHVCCVLSSSTLNDVEYKILKKSHILSPPETLQMLPLRETITPVSTVPDLTITRISSDPDAFLLRNFLSAPEEQLSLIMSAVNQGMEYSGTSSGDVVSHRFNCYTSWIYPSNEDDDEDDYDNTGDIDQDGSTMDIPSGSEICKCMTELVSLLCVPRSLKCSNKSVSFSCEAEPVQVVRYGKDGKYDIHHDGYNRFLTVLTYLNGVAGTWFPFAVVDKETNYNHGNEEYYVDLPEDMYTDVAKNKVAGKNGLLIVGSEYDEKIEEEKEGVDFNKHIVRVQPGDALVFYSYDWINSNTLKGGNGRSSASKDESPPTGPIMNYRSVHSGLTTTKSEKWIATNWFRVTKEDDEES